jgi:hypothetical protein
MSETECYRCKIKTVRQNTAICKDCQVDIETAYIVFDLLADLIDQHRKQLIELLKEPEKTETPKEKDSFSDKDIVE